MKTGEAGLQMYYLTVLREVCIITFRHKDY